MNQKNSIIVKDIKKCFKVYFDKGNSLKEKILFKNRNKYELRYVLNGISFEIKKGQAVGLIGHNGCGKSTTLKLLNRIMYPDSGSIVIDGKVSSLIELGAGFHPDMSGKENIYINASIFGLTRKQIDARIDDIIAFSELEKFIDNPVRTYSSGMYMRLAFAVAINVEADILLIDEILAVGDTNFQRKCFDKLKEIKQNGVTIVIVSHSLGQIESICDRTIWIHEGLIKEDGKCSEVHKKYNQFMDELRKKTVLNNVQKIGNEKVIIKDVKIYNDNDKECYDFNTGENIKIKFNYVINTPIKDGAIKISIFRNDKVCCYECDTKLDSKEINLIENGIIVINYNNIQLMKGEYYCDIIIKDEKDEISDYVKEAVKFSINTDNELGTGICYINHIWENLERKCQ